MNTEQLDFNFQFLKLELFLMMKINLFLLQSIHHEL